MNINNVHVSSEIGKLKRVIVHRPDEGIARISPKEAEELLFDDIVYLPQMQAEHDVFTQVLEAFLGKANVLETRQLLVEALQSGDESRKEMIELIVDYEELPKNYGNLLLDMDEEELADVLITGYYAEDDYFLFDPIPNFIFTRDIAVTINDHVVITKAAKEARFRENFLTRYICWAHPIFSPLREAGRIINMNKVDLFPPSKRGEFVSVEGGDVMVINEDYVLIGCSERSTAHGIRSLRDVLFDKGVVKNVVQINIPNDRSFMHIDTIFTQIHHNHIVGFKPIVVDGLSSTVEVYRQHGKPGFYHSIKDFILEEINPNMRFILSGNGESPYQEREQWTDGCNLVAIKPGVAITYDRNPKTEEAFAAAGYSILHAYDFLRAYRSGKIDPQKLENTIIAIPSNELSRARGGSHCMTCPIEREAL
ncbi:MAG: arginine deiminase family protein [Saprospiraceae bacterium]